MTPVSGCPEHTEWVSGCAGCGESVPLVEVPPVTPPPVTPCDHGPLVLCVKCPPQKLIGVIQATEQHLANPPPLPMLLWCPECGERHIDRGAFAAQPHHTHACQECGMTWRPAVVATCGVLFLPGFRDAVPAAMDGGPA